QQLVRELLALRDPANGQPVITRVDLARQVYSAPYAADAPDLLIGYNRGYRSGWGTVLGAVPAAVFEDNLDPWSGDHCMDFRQVPGVLLSNRPLLADDAALTDIAPTLLALYGIPQPGEMKGKPVLGAVAFRVVAKGGLRVQPENCRRKRPVRKTEEMLGNRRILHA